MTCEEALLLISGHLDRENTEEEETLLQAHLQTCSACEQLLELLRGQDAAIEELSEEAPSTLCGNVMDAIRQEKAERKNLRRGWRALAVAAALALVIGIGALTMPKHDNTVEPDGAAVPMMASEDAQPQTLQLPEARTFSVSDDSCYSLAIEIAEARRAEVIVLETLPDEFANAPAETVAEGWLLYTLPAADTASELKALYHGDLSAPSEPDPACAVSYALIQIPE